MGFWQETIEFDSSSLFLSVLFSSSPLLLHCNTLQQGIGCPSDLPSALAQYEYAAKDGHAKAAMAAGNILYDNLIMEKPLLFHADSYDSVVDIRYR